MLGFYFHLKKTTKRILYGLLLFLFALTLSTSRAPTQLEEVINRGELRVITLMGSTTYFQNAKGEGGFEYWLASAFAEYLGVELRMTPRESVSGAIIAIGGPLGDMAAAGLTVTPQRQKALRFSEPYYEVTQKLIYRNGSRRPRDIEDLAGGQLLVIPQSSHSERLEDLKNDEYPSLEWREASGLEMLDLMAMVDSGEVEYAIVDSISFQVDRGIYPRARGAFDISEPQPIAWAFPRHGDDSLVEAANRFLEGYEASGELDRLKKRSLIQTNEFNFAGSQLFMKRVSSRLPDYQEMFQEVAQKYGIEWQLLAAIAYQESHWDHKATSPTGVRGLMMLTLPTAKEMGIKNRLDPRQSLDGGTRYFLQTKSRIPDDITEPDRTWFAMAGYNIGLGHLEDARVLTERAGSNPHLWNDVKEFLPLLQQKKYYSTVKYGYARGYEPVSYVRNVRHFRTILNWHTLDEKRRLERENRLELPNSSDWNTGSMLSL
ncbi:membrane-bound lytic murein transglycosylase MltF [Porticoccus sp.]|uniref:membrane-bound lytic murein transglycosylase MltF n=1 Tax=Porticoccus sp. TaxID=2024853 RepID=UPI000C5DA388|nr:membrane-bound lytic murein transglycosylase MltF [Porticoccus sp.]MAZ70476.1 membrane-bound lytic murein transglycosylase MltF [Porticoccus sp.]